MIRKVDHKKMGRSTYLDWLDTHFHFSFAEYYNPDNISFGMLRVVNDDIVQPGTGFDMHPHKNMEVVSYVIEGELTHGDSFGNIGVLHRGDAQYLSAGTGAWHSEHATGEGVTRFLQIWTLPNKIGVTPNYGDYHFPWEDRENKWLHIVSGSEGNAPIKIHQDMDMHVLSLDANKEIGFEVGPERQAYLVQIEGSANVNGEELVMRDGLESIEESLKIKTHEKSHFIVFEMSKIDLSEFH